MEVLMQGIGKAFGPVRVLEGVDFHISAGEIHALMGENGAGKSTLMKILCGVYQADAGKILIDGSAAQIRNTVEATTPPTKAASKSSAGRCRPAILARR